MKKLSIALLSAAFLVTSSSASFAKAKKYKRWAGESSIFWSGKSFGFRKKTTARRKYFVRRFGKFRSLRRPHNKVRYSSSRKHYKW